jgi:hypothetical protein
VSAAAPATRTASEARRRTRRRNGAVALLAVGLLVVLTLQLGAPGEETPLDPASVAPDGLRGVVDLLRSVDVDVDVSTRLPSDPSVRVFVPAERFAGDRHDELRAWVEAGGTLVVAGESTLHDLAPASVSLGDAFGSSARPPGCAAAGLATLDAVLAPNWPMLVGSPDAAVCFGPPGAVNRDGGGGADGDADADADGDASDDEQVGWLVATGAGAGRIVAIGSAAPLTNRWLGEEDNAGLAAALLAPAPGDAVVILPPPTPGELGQGSTPLAALVPDGVWRGLWLAGVAALAAAVWRGRRLGRPVAERLPPVLPSAELARSIGGLLQRAGSREQAAATLREDLRTTASRSLGVPGALPQEHLAATVGARTGLPLDTARAAVVDAPVPDDAALTAVAVAVAAARAALRAPRIVHVEEADTPMGR